MAIELQAVDGGIVLVPANRLVRRLQIGGAKGLEQLIREHDALAGQVPEQRFGNIHAHFQQTALRIIGGQGLVFMLVGIGEIRLADPAQRAIAIDFGEHADFQAPITRDTVDPGQIGWQLRGGVAATVVGGRVLFVNPDVPQAAGLGRL